MRRFWILAVGLSFLPLAGCSHETTPDEAMQVMTKSLAENKPQVAWEGLPPSYQKDVDGLVKEFAGKMDPELWDSGFGVAKKIVRILKEKKEYILENPMLAAFGADTEKLSENWEAVVKALDIVINSDISKLDKLKSLQMEEFLSTTGADFMEHMSALAEVSQQENLKNNMAAYKSAKFTLIESKGDTATIKVETPNKPAEDVAMVKVEGKWIPQELADTWADKIKEAKESLANINTEEMQKNKPEVLAQIKMVDAQLNLLLDSKSADEFNGKLMAMAAMMGGGGGGKMPAELSSDTEFDFGPGQPEDTELPGIRLPTDESPEDSVPEGDSLFGDDAPKAATPKKPATAGEGAFDDEAPESDAPKSPAPASDDLFDK